jgi:glycosyltransferase involved in cell wall biosynthesis
MKKLAIIYQHMAPTRVPVFDELSRILGDRMMVFYPTSMEGDRRREWLVPANHPHKVLDSRSVAYSLFGMKRYVHWSPGMWRELTTFAPDCLVVYNFHPAALAGWAYAMAHRKKFVVATDGCLKSDRKNSPLHPLLRKTIIPTAVAAVGTSRGSFDLFNRYADFRGRYFTCHLCADNAASARYRENPRRFDLMFAGQFIPRKLPHFFVDVVEEIRKKRPEVSVLLMGDGPERESVLNRLSSLGVRYQYEGFVPNERVAPTFASARLFLFPTTLDAYGVVANEALAVGTPVMCNDEPGAAGEVVIDGRTGYVLPLDPKLWAEMALALLSDSDRYRRFYDAGFQHVQQYSFRAAAAGLNAAFEYATSSVSAGAGKAI